MAHDLWAAATDLLLGARCPGCDRPGRGLCEQCRERLAAQDPVRRVLGGLPSWAAGEYADPVRGMLSHYKEHQAWWLGAPLAGLLARSVARCWSESGWQGPVDLLVVPSRPAAVRERGLDTGRRIAVLAARELRGHGLAVRAVSGLRPVRGLRDQAGLGVAARRQNLAGALRARPATGSAVRTIVVDDVSTTGATLTEALRASAAVGRRTLGTAVVAATAASAGQQGRPQLADQ